jgi:hypothetical protein
MLTLQPLTISDSIAINFTHAKFSKNVKFQACAKIDVARFPYTCMAWWPANWTLQEKWKVVPVTRCYCSLLQLGYGACVHNHLKPTDTELLQLLLPLNCNNSAHWHFPANLDICQVNFPGPLSNISSHASNGKYMQNWGDYLVHAMSVYKDHQYPWACELHWVQPQ